MKFIKIFFLIFSVSAFSSQAKGTSQCTTDAFGNMSCHTSEGISIRGHTDSFGNSTYRDSQGNTTRGHTDSFGNSTYRDSQGNTTRCTSDSFGNTRCY